MGRPIRATKYDAYILESFQMGKNPNEIYEFVNFQELNKGDKPVISRGTIYNMYKRWVNAGKPGELYSEQYKNDEGELVVIWREVKKGNTQ